MTRKKSAQINFHLIDFRENDWLEERRQVIKKPIL
jgi:hypothetical protein